MKNPGPNRVTISMVFILMILFTSFTFTQVESVEVVQGLIVPPGETRIIRDQSLFIQGDMDIQGTLVLENVDMVLNTSSPGSYTVHDGGVLNIRDSHIISYEDNLELEFSVELEPGFNTLSFPFKREDDSVENVLAPLEGHYDKIFSYDPWDPVMPWKTYVVGRPDHYNSLREINRTMGVSINITNPVVLEQRGNLPYLVTIPLKEGFNMVSYPLHEPMLLSQAFSGMMESVKWVEVETGHGTVQLGPGDHLMPGRGYRIQMYESAYWNIEVPYSQENLHGSGFNFQFMEGSMVSIENSEIYGSRNPEAQPEFTVLSNQVSFIRNSFVGGSETIRIEESSPTIRDSTFRAYRTVGIRSESASPAILNNNFDSHRGPAISTMGGFPVIVNNRFRGYRGIEMASTEVLLGANTFKSLSGPGMLLEDGVYTLEDNRFSSMEGPSVESFDSRIHVNRNTFLDSAVGVRAIRSLVQINENLFDMVGNGVMLSDSGGSVFSNEMKGSGAWALHTTSAQDLVVEGNTVYNGTNGMRLAGDIIIVRGNVVENNSGVAISSSSCSDLRVEDNLIRYNRGPGMYMENSEGVIMNNTIYGNEGGIWTDSSLWIYHNLIFENSIYGVSVVSGSPYLKRNHLLNNTIYGMKFDSSSATLSTTTITGSRYELHLTRSNISVMDSLYQHDMVWKDSHSRLEISHSLNLTIKEDSAIRDFDLRSILPPGSLLLDVRDVHPIQVSITDHGVDFVPPANFHGTVEMFFQVGLSENLTTWLAFSLEVTPVNDPPVIREISVDVYQGRARWTLEYVDLDGYAPNYVEIVINGHRHPMVPLDPVDYGEGVLYVFEKPISPGSHVYYYTAQEYNPLGPNLTVTSEEKVLEVESGTPDVFGFFGQILLFVLVVVLFLLIIYKLLSNQWSRERRRLNLEGAKWIEDYGDEDGVGDRAKRTREKFHKLPLMKKKDRSKLPLLRRKSDRKRMLRVLAEEAAEEEEESIIDVVGDVAIEPEVPVRVPPEGIKKHRKIKSEKESYTVRKKYRALREDGSGKRRRVLKV